MTQKNWKQLSMINKPSSFRGIAHLTANLLNLTYNNLSSQLGVGFNFAITLLDLAALLF